LDQAGTAPPPVDPPGTARTGISTDAISAAALDSVSNGVFVTDVAGIIVWVNAAFTAMSGYSADEAIGGTPRLLKSGHQDDTFYEQLWTTILAGQPWHGEVTNRHKNGHRYTVAQTVTPIADEHNKVTNFVAVHHDLTPLRAHQRRAQHAFEQSFDPQILISDDGAIVEANQAASDLTGHSVAELQQMTMADLPFVRDRQAVAGFWSQVRATGSTQGKLEIHQPDGNVVQIALHGRNGIADDLYLVVARDVTTQHRLDRLNVRTAQVLDAVNVAVITTDLDGKIDGWNSAAEQLSGWSAHDAVGQSVFDVVVPAGQDDAAQGIVAEIQHAGSWSGTFDIKHRNGMMMPIHLTGSLLCDDDGQPIGMVGVAIDISERIRSERQLALDNAWLRSMTQHVGAGFATLDVNGRIVYMNPAGEELLMVAEGSAVGGSFLNRLLGVDTSGDPGDVRKRMIGEEFTTLVNDKFVEDRLLRSDGSIIPIEYIATQLPSHDGQPSGWVITFRDITERLEREAQLRADAETAQWVQKIQRAIADDRFVLFAQPIVDVATRATVQHELLIRMLDNDGTLIPPASFIRIAEQQGLMPAIDRWVIHEAIELARQGHKVELNISATSLSDETLIHVIEGMLAESGADPQLLTFEITETAIAENLEAATLFVERLHAIGCPIAIDDFGVGYGGFTYLKALPIDILKIDMAFVRDLVESSASHHVVSAVVSLAETFNLTTVAEGVETDAILNELTKLGVDHAQGYLFGRPQPLAEVFGQTKDLT